MKNDTIAAAKQGVTGIDSEYSIAILAGWFDMSPSNIYGLQQRNIIPVSGTYREAVTSYINYWKGKATKKSGSILEIGAVRKAELDRARTVSVWYGVRKDRSELIDKEEFVQMAQPIFSGMRTELMALTRKHPELKEDISKVLNGVAARGVTMLSKHRKAMQAQVEAEIQTMADMEQEVIDASPTHPEADKPASAPMSAGDEMDVLRNL